MMLQRLTVPSGLGSSISSLPKRVSAFPVTPRCSYSTSSPAKASYPLRILFCGSDIFSCYSLKALHAEHKSNPNGLIKSIDVMVRPGKAVGRGYKEIRQVPIQQLAEELSLPIHIRDTFTGWNLPQTSDGKSINLIVAVSFGLFVPPRILGQAKYGGLNVHPSLLPDLRGPAPLHHALLHRLSHTGVSLQTLSPTTFDAGTVIAQTPLPGIPIPQDCTVQQLHDLLAPLGADMLVSSLRQGLHIPPLVPVVDNSAPQDGKLKDGRVYKHAPKITKSDQRLSFLHDSASSAALRARVCGQGGTLWTNVYVPHPKPRRSKLKFKLQLSYPHPLEQVAGPKRMIFEEVSELVLSSDDDDVGVVKKRYEAYQSVNRQMNSGKLRSNVVVNQPSGEASSDPDFWLLRFSEDKYIEMERMDDFGEVLCDEEVTEMELRASWGLATNLGLDDAKEEDKGAVTFVMGGNDGGGFGLLRVGKIKVEGKGSRPARQVVKELAVQAA